MAPPRRSGISLTVRVVAFLSLALLPLGAIGVWQTTQISERTAAQTRATLLAITESVANPMQATLQRTFGAANAAEARVLQLRDDPEACSDYLAELVEVDDLFVYAGFVDTSGLLRCGSDGVGFDFSQAPFFLRAIAAPRPRVMATERGSISQSAVLVVTELVEDDAGDLVGFLSISVPLARLVLNDPLPAGSAPLSLVTFSADGEVLTSTEADDPGRILPSGRSLAELAGTGAQTFRAETVAGVERVFASVPIMPGVAHAIASWSDAGIGRTPVEQLVLSGGMPILMWLASLVVAYVALDRLVVRHIRTLSRQMRFFARTRHLPSEPVFADGGVEFAEIEDEFRNMGRVIMQDEARLEDNLREKNILLKEVHHRVKNNLQLISSIMNMQVRRAGDPSARAVLLRLQDRLNAIASVHRLLYNSDNFVAIDAGALLREQVRQIMDADRSVHVASDIDNVKLTAEQAVPLAMLASEALTNAVRHANRAKDGDPVRVDVTLQCQRKDGEGCDRARLTIRSPLPEGKRGEAAAVGMDDGLGHNLIRAFEAQLDGSLYLGRDGDDWLVELNFPVQSDRPATKDY